MSVKNHGIKPEEIISIYRRRAGSYNFISQFYYLLGFRGEFYRKNAIESLEVKLGDTVVDACCGTGLNFSLLQRAIGPKGKLIGVDLTDAMLKQARKRIEKNGWKNVELVQCDISEYEFPDVNGILTTFALSLVPNYDKVIREAHDALVSGGRFVDMNAKMPNGLLRYLKPLIFPLIKPFGDPEKYMYVRTWESVDKYFSKSYFKEFFSGAVYITCGEK